jgi:hypothetical protein
VDAETMAKLMAFFLAGEQLGDDNGPVTDVLATGGHMHDPNSFLVWNGEDGDLFMVTVTKCGEA